MDFATKPIQNHKESCWMHQLQTICSYRIKGRIRDEFKTDNKHKVVAKFLSLPRFRFYFNKAR